MFMKYSYYDTMFIHYNHYIHMYCLLYQNTPICHLEQEHSFATMNSEMRWCFVSLNFLWCLFFCSRSLFFSLSLSLSLSLLYNAFHVPEGVSNSDYLRICQLCFWAYFITLYVGINQVTHPANMLVSKQRALDLDWVHGKPTWVYRGCIVIATYRPFHGSHGLWPGFTVAHPGKRKAKLTLPCFWCWPCKYPCQICFAWFGRTYHRQLRHGILMNFGMGYFDFRSLEMC